MMLNLVIDIGNTRVKAALFSQGVLKAYCAWPTVKIALIEPWLTNQKWDRSILANTGGAFLGNLEDLLRSRAPYLRFDRETPVPVKNAYKTPETLGLDRLAAVTGAYALYPGEHCLVIDAGTCLTFDFLEAPGIYCGGNISPGLQMRLSAMHLQTARLPLVELKVPEQEIGYSTETALQNGVLLGAAFEVEGYIRRWEQEWQSIRVLLTGGDAAVLAIRVKNEIFVHQHLVLQGLNKIVEYNAQA